VAIGLKGSAPTRERESARTPVYLCDNAFKSEHGFTHVGVNIAVTVKARRQYVRNEVGKIMGRVQLTPPTMNSATMSANTARTMADPIRIARAVRRDLSDFIML